MKMRTLKFAVTVASVIAGSLACWASVPLPANYTQLDWIESTGSQYINTGIKGHGMLESEVEVEFLGDACHVLSSYHTNASFCYYMIAIDSGKLGYGRGYAVTGKDGASYKHACDVEYNHKYTIITKMDTNDQSMTVDGVVCVTSAFTSGITTSDTVVPLFLFGRNSSGSLDNGGRMRISRCKITENNFATTLRDYVPCRNPDGLAGMWDCASGTFFGNDGKGRFLGSDGEDEGMVSLDYLESDGTQYINTGVNARSGLESEIEVEFLGNGFPMAAYDDNYCCYMPSISDGKLSYRYGRPSSDGKNYQYACNVTYNHKYTLITKMDKNAQSLTVDGTELVTSAFTSSFSTSIPLYLFGRNYKNKLDNGGRMRISRCKITENNFATTLRDYVPQISGGQIGMYDRENNVLYPSSSAKDFSFGIAYTTNETTLAIHEGHLAEANLTGWTAVEKVSPYVLGVTNVAACPVPFTHRAGTLSLVNGETNGFTVAGTLACVGGAHLRLDLTTDGCDLVSAAALDLSAASKENPVVIDLVLEEGAVFNRRLPFLRAAGLTDDMAEKFVVRGLAGICVRLADGALVLESNSVTVAVWTGAGIDSQDVTDPANWACTNGIGNAISAIPTAETSVILPENCTFNCTNGKQLVCREVSLPATLGGDSDLRGIAAPLRGTMNLAGHSVRLDSFSGSAVITGGCGSGDYQFLDYLESDGTQYINTGVKGHGMLESEVEVEFLGDACHVLCSYHTNASFCYYMVAIDSGKLGYRRGYAATGKDGASYKYACDVEYNHKYTIITKMDRNDQSMTVDGVVCVTSAFTSGITTSDTVVPLFLFGRNYSGSLRNGGRMRIFRCKITENNFATTLRDYVPALQVSTERVGMYDRQNDKFYPNDGTGVFLVGHPLTVGGEVRIEVPAGLTVTNDVLKFSGNLKLVKAGTGTFVAAKSGQTYLGGTEVAAGTFRVAATDEKVNNYVGVAGGAVTVEEGATLDVNGNPGFTTHPIILAGGTLKNGTGSTPSASVGAVTLTADSAILAGNGITHMDNVALGGKVLAMTTSGEHDYSLASGVSYTGSGTVSVSGGYFKFIGSAARDMSGIDLTVSSAVFLEGNVTVRNLESTYTGEAGTQGTAATKFLVTGTYKPASAFHRGCEMQDGSTLDLSALTGPVSNVTFAANSTVTVSLGGRKARNEKIVSWTTMPDNAVTFASDPALNARLVRKTDGLWLKTGFLIRIR